MAEGSFLWPDYLVFGLILAMSAAIGVYHGIVGRKKQTMESYLMADRNMHPFPVALSMFVTYMSAISFLGDPVEVYSHGAVYVFIGLGYMLVMPVFAHVFAPLYQSLKLTSAYEYLGMRYNYFVRVLGTMLNTSVLIYSGIALYAPSLALSQVTGIPLTVTIVSTGLICTIYTTLGGMKAVLWADSAQLVVMLLGVIILLVKGCMHLGGFDKVLEIAEEGGRLNFWTFDPNIFRRSTFWTYLVGGWFRILVAFSSSQMFIQRMCTVNTKQKATLVSYLLMPLFGGIVIIFLLTGIVLYAYFGNCDPLLTGRITKRDQMLPLMMTELLHFIPGLPGLFLACLYCAALSTLSSAQNGLATTFMADILLPIIKKVSGKSVKDNIATHMARAVCFIVGLANIVLALIIDAMDGSIFKMTLTIDAMLTSPKAGVFILGVLAPVVDTVSALVGASCALVLTLYLGLSTNISPAPSQALPFSTASCNTSFSDNVTDVWSNGPAGNHTATVVSHSAYTASASSVSPLLISPVGVIVTCLVGLSVGHIRALYKRRHRKEESCGAVPDELLSCPIDNDVKKSQDTNGHLLSDTL